MVQLLQGALHIIQKQKEEIKRYLFFFQISENRPIFEGLETKIRPREEGECSFKWLSLPLEFRGNNRNED